jgi:hypothetical protein
MDLADQIQRMFQAPFQQPFGLVGKIPYPFDRVAKDTTYIPAAEDLLHLILCRALNLNGW